MIEEKDGKIKLGRGKERSSNLELYRILVMFLIVAHHYVVNSSLQDVMNQNILSLNTSFFSIFGA